MDELTVIWEISAMSGFTSSMLGDILARQRSEATEGLCRLHAPVRSLCTCSNLVANSGLTTGLTACQGPNSRPVLEVKYSVHCMISASEFRGNSDKIAR